MFVPAFAAWPTASRDREAAGQAVSLRAVERYINRLIPDGSIYAGSRTACALTATGAAL